MARSDYIQWLFIVGTYIYIVVFASSKLVD
jgi:hypothetical protein